MLVTSSAFHAHFFATIHFGVTADHLFVIRFLFFFIETGFAESKIPIGKELRKVVLYCQELYPK